MDELTRLRERHASLSELRDLFRAMRGIAASQMQNALSALDGVRRYAGTVEAALHACNASSLPVADHANRDGAGKSVRIVFFSEHGFVGAMNDSLLEKISGDADRDLILIGRRGAALALEHGVEPADILEMTTHVEGVVTLARQLAERAGRFEQVDLLYVLTKRGGVQEITEQRILPFVPGQGDPGQGAPGQGDAAERQAAPAEPFDPLIQLPPAILAERLVREYVFVELARAGTEALASECAARLRVMEAAEHNAGDKLTALIREEQQSRQNTITSELLDVVAGSLAQ